MNEKSYTYQTPQERLQVLIKNISADLRDTYPNLTRQELTEIWRSNEKDLEELQK
ncbi:MAG: hypothetical protein KI793_29360 [Rivularia sp. (in: Bacteria)]|nr:hypothetical protein [Rivularia sp. MS3]